jgi:hypothetical protein
MKAALGLRAHSGWAALVAVAGTRRSVEVVDRRRIDLADPAVPGPKQPYHEAEGQALPKARRIVKSCAEQARRRALKSLRAVVAELRSQGEEVVGCGLLLASGRPLPALESILASHALIHTADGELFREAIVYASRECDLPVAKVRERELSERAVRDLRIPADQLQRLLAEMGRKLGPPWRQDEKLAATAAWIALAASSRP